MRDQPVSLSEGKNLARGSLLLPSGLEKKLGQPAIGGTRFCASRTFATCPSGSCDRRKGSAASDYAEAGRLANAGNMKRRHDIEQTLIILHAEHPSGSDENVIGMWYLENASTA